MADTTTHRATVPGSLIAFLIFGTTVAVLGQLPLSPGHIPLGRVCLLAAISGFAAIALGAFLYQLIPVRTIMIGACVLAFGIAVALLLVKPPLKLVYRVSDLPSQGVDGLYDLEKDPTGAAFRW